MKKRASNPPIPRRLKVPIKAAIAQGWTYDWTAKNHPRLTPPPGTTLRGERCGPITFALTPSDSHSDRNALARLRGAGVRF